MQKEDALELRGLFTVIRRRAWLIIGCILLALVVAFGITSRMPPAYEATTTLMVGPAEEKSTSEYNTLMAGERLALTYSQMLKEPSTLQAAISRLGLDETPETLAKRIKTEPIKDTQLVRVTARDSSPGRAALVANTIAEIFTEHLGGLQEDRNRGYVSKKEAEIETQRKLIEETQAQVDAVGTKKVSDETELTRLQGILADYRNTDRTRQQDYQSLQLLVERVKDNVKIVETARVPAAAFQFPYTATVTLLVDQSGIDAGSGYSGILASERLAATYAQMVAGPSVLETASTRLGARQSPDALAANVKAESIAGTQLVRLQLAGTDAAQTAQLANTIAQVFVEQMQEMLVKPYTGRLTRMQDEGARLAVLIENTQAEIQARTAAKLRGEMNLTQLQSALAEYRSNYRALQQEVEQMRLSEAQAPGTVVITERAHEPQKPVRTRTLYILLAGLIATLVALGIAFLIEYLDETIKTPEDVNHAVGLNTVGVIEKLAKPDQRLVVALRPQSPAAEAFRVLAANIRLSALGSQLRTLLITSPMAADGKSMVAANLSVAMANAGLRVVVVDADLRLPRLHQLFWLSQGKGLSDALQSGTVAGALKATDVPGLRVLTSGMPPPEAVKAISSPNMKTLLTELQKEADIVIIDSPPALAVADTAILAAEVDGVLLVLRAGRTWSASAQHAMEALRQARTHMIGVVLNAVPVRNDSYYRYYGGSRAYLQRGSLSPRGVGRAGAISGEDHGAHREGLQPGVTMRKRWLATIPAVILLGALLFIAREPILLSVGDSLVIQDRLQPADVIHVISGPDYRTDYAIQLYKQGYGKRIFFTGGWCPEIEGNHAERAELRALEQGVPAQSIGTDGSEVTSTYSETVRLRDFIRLSAAPVRSVIVVSDPYHMRRARWTDEKVLGEDIAVQMAPVSFDATPYQHRWWQDQASRQYVVDEYLKYFYYLARYQLAFGPVKNWLASLDRG